MYFICSVRPTPTEHSTTTTTPVAQAKSKEDSFSCSNCCQHFTLREAETHFQSRMHFNGNVVKCGGCDVDTVGAKVKSYPDFLKYYTGHNCAGSTASTSSHKKRTSDVTNSSDQAKKAKKTSVAASAEAEGPPPPGLLVSGRDCIEIEIDSD